MHKPENDIRQLISDSIIIIIRRSPSLGLWPEAKLLSMGSEIGEKLGEIIHKCVNVDRNINEDNFERK